MTQILSRHAVLQTCGLTLAVLPFAGLLWRKLIGNVNDQNLVSLLAVIWKYRSADLASFMKSHRAAIKKGEESGEELPKGGCWCILVIGRVDLFGVVVISSLNSCDSTTLRCFIRRFTYVHLLLGDHQNQPV